MDIHNLEQIKQEFSGFQQEFETGNKERHWKNCWSF